MRFALGAHGARRRGDVREKVVSGMTCGWHLRSGAAAVFVVAVLALVGMPPPAFAADGKLKTDLTALLENHQKIRAAEADLTVAKENLAVTKGLWNPTLAVTSSYGHERQLKGNETQDTQMVPRTLTASVTQKIWDFGSTNSAIRSGELTVRQSQAAMDTARQALLLEALTAHLNLVSAAEVVRYARESEANIKKQAELEDAKVQRGSGFSTDVLQAKAQLAGAQARRVQAEGALRVAQNRYQAVFGAMPTDMEGLERLATPADMIPASLEEAVKVALEENPLLISTRFSGELARETIVKTEADSFAPVVNGVLTSNNYRDYAGTVGDKYEQLAKVELSYSINLGLTALNTLKAAESTHAGLNQRLIDAERQIEESTRNAWTQLLTARENAELLRNQANITGEFLEDARKERALGRRSLIDVLSNETELINASSAASQAEMSVVVASYTLLSAMGRLELDTLR